MINKHFQKLMISIGAVILLLTTSINSAESTRQQSVSALGRFEPEDGVIRISAPSTARSLSGSLVKELFVKKGDDVKKGDLLATTDSITLSEVALKQAQASLELNVVEGRVVTNTSEEVCIIANYAKRESERRINLFKRKLASEEETEQAQVDEKAKAALCRAANIKVQLAESKINLARVNVEYQKVELDRTMILAPVTGRVLDVLVQPGERITSNGLLELGKIARMHVIAEVYETDIGRVKIDQLATISSSVLAEPLHGKVLYINQKVAKQDVIDTDPAADKDARIIEVEILLNKPELAASLTYLQVQVIIKTN